MFSSESSIAGKKAPVFMREYLHSCLLSLALLRQQVSQGRGCPSRQMHLEAGIALSPCPPNTSGYLQHSMDCTACK